MKNTIIDLKNEKISRIILKLAPPVMLAQLIQALYNVVDSIFIGRYDENGLTALSIIYPVQLLMIALAVGTGVGINTGISRYNGLDDNKNSREISGVCPQRNQKMPKNTFCRMCLGARNKLFSNGIFPYLSGAFSGNKLSGQKLPADNSEDSRSVCPAWIYFRKVWIKDFLVYLSCYGNNNKYCRVCILS